MKFSLLGFEFEFRVQIQQLRIRDNFGMSSEDRAQRRKDSSLPVDQGAVAVEGQHFEFGEIEHAKKFLALSRQHPVSALRLTRAIQESPILDPRLALHSSIEPRP